MKMIVLKKRAGMEHSKAASAREKKRENAVRQIEQALLDYEVEQYDLGALAKKRIGKFLAPRIGRPLGKTALQFELLEKIYEVITDFSARSPDRMSDQRQEKQYSTHRELLKEGFQLVYRGGMRNKRQRLYVWSAALNWAWKSGVENEEFVAEIHRQGGIEAAAKQFER